MILKLFLLFTIVPLTELVLLIQLGTVIGALETVAIVLGTALTGAVLIKIQGWMVIDNMMEAVLEKRFPAEEILSAVIVVISGCLLITPGVLTDIVSIFILLPPGSSMVKEYLKKKIKEKINSVDIKTIRINKP